MAYKRKLVVDKKEQETVEDEQPKELSWRDWFLKRYAKYWYWVGVIFLDIIIFFEVQRSLHLDIMLALMFVILALVSEFYLYARLWGRYGPLREKNKEEDEN